MTGIYANSFTALRLREHDVFLSHAHVDNEAVVNLKRWLEETAGLRVWFDADKMGGG